MRSHHVWWLAGLLVVGMFCGVAAPVSAQKRLGPDAEKLQTMRQKGIEYLKKNQNPDGSWSEPRVIGFTALATTALVENGLAADDPTVRKALDFLLQYVQKDGGIYHPQTKHRNYETSIILMALTEVNQDGKFETQINNARRFLQGLQWDEDEELTKSDTAYGGAGYGGHSRPDLSNTQFLLEALKKSGLSADDPAFQKATIFVSRCQNLDSEYNDTAFADKINDGGFYYTPAAGGSSQAGKTPEGGLRSYASMTYAGLKSLIYAGVTADDPRVKAAKSWLQAHYSLDENPGMGQQGLFYYYQVFAKTLEAMGTEQFETADGKQHDWRQELTEKLFEQQREDGSWTNQADRWYEGDPALVTAYALLALSHCDPIPSIGQE